MSGTVTPDGRRAIPSGQRSLHEQIFSGASATTPDVILAGRRSSKPIALLPARRANRAEALIGAVMLEQNPFSRDMIVF
jgi:hypothetical protein